MQNDASSRRFSGEGESVPLGGVDLLNTSIRHDRRDPPVSERLKRFIAKEVLHPKIAPSSFLSLSLLAPLILLQKLRTLADRERKSDRAIPSPTSSTRPRL
jgi:hypothetical protein